ncbi:MAG: GNAT family N-acetyltransferase, partial [Romboutsia sp.]|nr:GNAT family N-acetyltransferase [Romboutsia sp.]
MLEIKYEMIRVATILDIDKIIEIAEQSFKIHYKDIISPEQIDYMYEKMYAPQAILQQMKEGQTFLLYFENENPLAFASYFIREDNSLYLSKLYIKYDYRRNKIGSKLLQFIENIVRKNAYSYIELNVNRKNNAMYFYKSLGFIM